MTPLDFLKTKKTKKIINLNDLNIKNDVLWHGLKLENAALGIDNGYLPPKTTQRYWIDGRYLKDDHQDYEKSGWMFGWSTTRERNFAGSWGGVVFIFDRKKIHNDFKIKPLSWSYRVSGGSKYYKKEREDFIISYKDPRTLKQVEDDYYKIIDADDYDSENSEFNSMYDYWYAHNGKKLNINKTLVGILISDSTIDIYGQNNDSVKKIMENEKFLGIYSQDSCHLNIKKQKNPAKSYNF